LNTNKKEKMKIRPIIFGSTGMIGQGVLLECLTSTNVEAVLVVNRQTCNITHPKLKEIIHKDFFDIAQIANEFKNYNTCFFCLGISSAGLRESDYYKTTYELTLSIAHTLHNANKDMAFCYISGAGTDSTEKKRIMWARVKGKTENALLKLHFKNAYMFRPGYIQPLRGIKSKTKLYNTIYLFLKPLYFILKPFKSIVTNTETLGKAMINAVIYNYEINILESKDINEIGLK
jgi:hypothetical protein